MVPALTETIITSKVPEVGLEPTQPQWPKDFKSFVSTIPPFGQLQRVGAKANTRKRQCCFRLLAAAKVTKKL